MEESSFISAICDIEKELLCYATNLQKNKSYPAKDLVQDTLLRMLVHKNTFRDETNFKAWAYTIMRNISNNIHKRDSIIKQRIVYLEDLENEVSEYAKSINNPEQIYEVKELNGILDLLPSEIWLPLNMFAYGMSYKEIAETFKVPVSTIKNRIHHGRTWLRKRSS